MSGARSTVLTTCASTPLLSAGGLCWPIAVPIPIPATSVSSQATNRSERLLPIAPSVGWVSGIGGRRVARPATLRGEARSLSEKDSRDGIAAFERRLCPRNLCLGGGSEG